MIIEEEMLESNAAESAASRRPARRRAVAIGVAALVAAGATVLTVVIRPGEFLRGMVDWVDGTRTIEQVFIDIDAQWAALDDGVSDPGP